MSAPVEILYAPPSVVVLEGRTAEVRVSLSRPTASGVMLRASVQGTGISPASLFDIFVGDAGTNLFLSPVPDSAVTGTRTSTITHTIISSTNAPSWVGVMSAPLQVTVLDAQLPGFYVETNRFSVREGRDTSVDVRLTTPPTHDVTLPVMVPANGEGYLDPSSPTALTFLAGQLSAMQRVKLGAVEDLVVDGTRFFMLRLGAPVSMDPMYAALPARDFAFAAEDEDTASAVVTPSSVVLVEGGAAVPVTVRLGTRPLEPVTVSLALPTGMQVAASPTLLVLDETNWSNGVTFMAEAVDDDLFDGDVVANIPLSLSSADPAYDAFQVASVRVTARSNERRLFITSSTSNGNLGGVAGADEHCNADAGKPSTLPYKALLAANVDRVASVTPNAGDGQVNWVLVPGARYHLGNGTLVGTAGSNGLITFPLVNAPGDTSLHWTGLNADWTRGTTCSSWTSGSLAITGSRGTGNSTDTGFISTGTSGCQSTRKLICVE